MNTTLYVGESAVAVVKKTRAAIRVHCHDDRVIILISVTCARHFDFPACVWYHLTTTLRHSLPTGFETREAVIKCSNTRAQSRTCAARTLQSAVHLPIRRATACRFGTLSMGWGDAQRNISGSLRKLGRASFVH